MFRISLGHLSRSQGDIYSGLAGEFPIDQTSSRFSCAGPDRKSNMQYMRALFVSEEAGEEAQGKMGDLMSKHTKKSERRSHGPRMVGLAGSEVSKVQLFCSYLSPCCIDIFWFLSLFLLYLLVQYRSSRSEHQGMTQVANKEKPSPIAVPIA